MRLQLFTVVSLLSVCLATKADTFKFSLGNSGSPISGSGILTATPIQSPYLQPAYQITAVEGSTDLGNGISVPIAGIEAPFSFGSNDNLLVEVSPGLFNFDSFSYGLTDGAEVNLFYFRVPQEVVESPNGNLSFDEVPYSVTAAAATPEPTSFALLGTGLLGVAGVVRKRALQRG